MYYSLVIPYIQHYSDSFIQQIQKLAIEILQYVDLLCN